MQLFAKPTLAVAWKNASRSASRRYLTYRVEKEMSDFCQFPCVFHDVFQSPKFITFGGTTEYCSKKASF